MPSQQFATLSTAEDQDFNVFRLRHELSPRRCYSQNTDLRAAIGGRGASKTPDTRAIQVVSRPAIERIC
jgi:hypothetical protein